MNSKIIQITVMPDSEVQYPSLISLCEDGTLWGTYVDRTQILGTVWSQIPTSNCVPFDSSIDPK